MIIRIHVFPMVIRRAVNEIQDILLSGKKLSHTKNCVCRDRTCTVISRTRECTDHIDKAVGFNERDAFARDETDF